MDADERDVFVKHDGGWERRSSRYLFESRWFNLRQDEVRLPNGSDITYTLVEHPGFVVVVPLLADGNVVLERIYRYTVQETVLECPAGGVDGDDPEDAARRELLEETGYAAAELRELGRFFGSTGISDALFHVFLATGLERVGGTAREETEQLEVVQVPMSEAVALAKQGQIACAPSTLALILAEPYAKDQRRCGLPSVRE